MRPVDFLNAFKSALSNVFSQTRITNPGEGENGSDVVLMDAGTPIPLTRLEQFGDVRCPPKDNNCVTMRKSDDGVVWSLCQPSTRPKDFKSGDRGLYCSQLGTVIKLYGDQSATPGVIELKQATGASVIIRQNGDIALTDADGNTAILSGDMLTVSDVVKAKHLAGDGLPPTASSGAAVGTGSATVFAGTDTAFVLLLIVSTGAPGTIATVNFQKPFALSPRFVGITPMDDGLTVPPVNGSFSFSSATDHIDINTSATIPDGTYFLSVGVIQ